MRVSNRLVGVWLLAAAAAMLNSGCASSSSSATTSGAATSKADPDRIVAMISVDGLAGFYFDDPKADMPNIRALAKDGARAVSMRAVAPTVTWPNHTTLVTGDYPARHGVVGNNYFDREAGKSVTLIADPVFDKDQIVKVPTVYDVAHEAGLRTAAVRWPASRNAKSLDWATPDVLTLDLVRQYTTPSVLADAKEAGFPIDTPDPESPKKIGQGAEQDEIETRAFLQILRAHRPNLALLHLVNVDHTEHLKGPRSPEAYDAIKTADAQVGRVWEQLKRDFPGKATLVVVSDHGFSPIDRMVLPNVILRDAGLVDVKGLRVVGGQVRVVVQGGAAMVYIADGADRAAVAAKVKKAFDGVDGVETVLGPGDLPAAGVADATKDRHAPDMMLFAKVGYAFGDTAGGALAFNEKPERRGTHGHNPAAPDLHATFVAWGAGIKPGARLGEIRNVDVAPTVAKLLGVPMKGVDGKPLDAALSQ